MGELFSHFIGGGGELAVAFPCFPVRPLGIGDVGQFSGLVQSGAEAAFVAIDQLSEGFPCRDEDFFCSFFYLECVDGDEH